MAMPVITGGPTRAAPARRAVAGRPGAGYRTVGPLLLARHHGEGARYERSAEQALVDGRDFVAIYMVLGGQARWSGEGGAGICRAGEVLLLDAASSFTIADDDGLDSLVLLAPWSFLLPVVGALPRTGVYAAAGSFGALRDVCERLLRIPSMALAVQAELLASALRHLAAAAIVAIGRHDSIRDRRQSGLLERCLAAIDARPAEPLEVASLCRILGCSRSSLYRAAAPVGGVADMVMRRKLANVHRVLRDPADPRSIAAIAQEHGFSRPTQFSRQFKRMFGATPGAVRAAARPGRHGPAPVEPVHHLTGAGDGRPALHDR